MYKTNLNIKARGIRAIDSQKQLYYNGTALNELMKIGVPRKGENDGWIPIDRSKLFRRFPDIRSYTEQTLYDFVTE